MNITTLILPRDLAPEQVETQTVIVFDVLRATTSMTSALAAGVREIRVFDSLQGAADAAALFTGPKLLCGERHTLPPAGFDLGNSPGQFDPVKHAGRTVFMSTTNGTLAIVAAQNAALLLTGALVNAAEVAKRAAAEGRDITLLCAGSDGGPSMEDLLGAGAVIDAIQQLASVTFDGDLSRVALQLFKSCRTDLPGVLAETYGGHNIRRAKLDDDILFAARLNVLPVVGQVMGTPLRVIKSN